MNKSDSTFLTIEWNRAPIWESAFKIAEAPMSCLNKLQNRYGNQQGCFFEFFDSSPTLFRVHGNLLLDGFKYRNLKVIKDSFAGFRYDIQESFIHLYEKKHLVAIVLATAIAFPTTVALVPVSMIADIFAGAIQASLRLFQGADKDEILSILHKKVIASPVQQSVYLLTSVIVLGILAGGIAGRAHYEGEGAFIPIFAISVLFWSALMGNVMYCSSQKFVAGLPRFLRPDGYNVFIEGGAEDEFGRKVDFDPEATYQKWRYKVEEAIRSDDTGEFAITRIKTQKDLKKLVLKFPEKFKEVRAWFESGKRTYELFGFSSADKVTENGLKRKYKFLVLQCHPDKFITDNEKKEAEIWFKLVNEARLDVEENILNKR